MRDICMISPSAQKVQDTLRSLGFACQVVEIPQSTRSAAEAAEAIGCRVEQIAKSLIFKAKQTEKPVLVIASGVNRVKEKKVAAVLGEALDKADADFVRQRTGFVIGRVPPIGHAETPLVFIDEDLLQYEEIWAAAGTPFAVFRLTLDDLVKMTGGRVIVIK
jgi:prolyl-tRNA editing enzyme YbaK/EbsC (Cys-tRNA(Pro) deacylase)